MHKTTTSCFDEWVLLFNSFSIEQKIQKEHFLLDTLEGAYLDAGFRTKQEDNLLFLTTEGDVLPFLIVGVISTKHPLSYEEAHEIIQEKFAHLMKENNRLHFALVSTGGFKDEAYAFEHYHVRLNDLSYVKKLLNKETNIELLPHNQAAFRSIVSEWKHSNRIGAIQATGTGKSYLAAKCIESFPGEDVLILSPSLLIFEQFSSLLKHSKANVSFMTYHKMLSFENDAFDTFRPSLIILDEFHRIGAEKWGTATLSFIAHHTEAYVVGFSATPIRHLDSRRDMGEELFGEFIATSLTLEEAIAKYYLPAPTYISSIYTLSEEAERLLEKVDRSFSHQDQKTAMRNEIDLIRQNWDKSEGVPSIFKKYMNPFIHQKFIVFAENIDHLAVIQPLIHSWLSSAFPAHSIKEFIVHSNRTQLDNVLELEAFSSEDHSNISLLYSVNMLNEGLHVEGVSGIIMMRKTISPTVFYQQLGRALSTKILEKPLIFDLVNNFDNVEAIRFLADVNDAIITEKDERSKRELPYLEETFYIHDENKELKELFQSIENRLMTSWDDFYDLLVQYKQETGHTLVPHEYVINERKLGDWVGKQRTLYQNHAISAERIERLNVLEFCWDLYDHKWNEGYHALLSYKKEKGHLRIVRNKVVNGLNLEAWCQKQRTYFKQNKLKPSHLKKLLDIGFSFLPFDDTWQEHYEILIQYVNEHDTFVISREAVYHGKRLDAWIELQRSLKRNGKLSSERIALLDAIQFVWEPHEEKWAKLFSLLCLYQQETGNTLVPAKMVYHGENLGNWVTDQRVLFKRGVLTPERFQNLQSIGFVWDAKAAAWDEHFLILKRFYENNGIKSIKPATIIDGKPIGNWISTQRSNFRNGTLSVERFQKLNSIGFRFTKNKKS